MYVGGTKMQLIGKGNTAEVFEYGNGQICKLFWEGYPQQAIRREYTNAKMMEQLGIAVPRCYGIVQQDQREGIVYEAIDGKTLLEHFFETGDANFLADTLVKLHKQLLNYHTQEVLSYKDFLYRLMGQGEDEDGDLLQKIRVLPEGDHLCHGDFHPQNIMIDAEGKIFVIDLMNVCHGPWQYDVARTYYLIGEGELPSDMASRDQILQMKMQLANLYLEKMKVSYGDIEAFVGVIRACRKHE